MFTCPSPPCLSLNTSSPLADFFNLQNLAGEPPVGVSTALCHQTSNMEGDAACEKNCVVYGGSGNGKGTFTLPAEICKPTYTATSSSAASTSTSIPSYPTSVKTSATTEYPHSSEVHTSKTSQSSSKEDYTTDTTDTTKPTSYPTFISTTGYPSSVTSVPSSVIYPTGNSTIVTTITTTNTPPTSGTGVPTGPATTSTNTPVPAGAVHNSAAGGALALVGLVAAYIL